MKRKRDRIIQIGPSPDYSISEDEYRGCFPIFAVVVVVFVVLAVIF